MLWEGVRRRVYRRGIQSSSTVQMCEIFKSENEKEDLGEREKLDDLMLTWG